MSTVQQRLAEINNPSDPSKARILLYKMGNGDCGVGCEFHKMAPALSYCYHSGRVLVLDGDWQFSQGKHSTDSTYKQWFEPVSNCSMKDVGEPVSWNVKDHKKHRVVKISPIRSYKELPPLFGVPDEFASRGWIWWLGQMVRYLMRPNPFLKKLVTEEVLRLRLGVPFIGMSVRHSTTWTYNRRNVPLAEYVEKIPLLGLPTNAIFLSTEDQKVIDQTKNFPKYRWFYTRNARKNLNQARAMAKGQLDGYEEGRIAMVNLIIMSGAEGLMATLRSNWGRLVYEHMTALRGKESPVISLDAIPALSERFGLGWQEDYNRYFFGEEE